MDTRRDPRCSKRGYSSWERAGCVLPRARRPVQAVAVLPPDQVDPSGHLHHCDGPGCWCEPIVHRFADGTSLLLHRWPS